MIELSQSPQEIAELDKKSANWTSTHTRAQEHNHLAERAKRAQHLSALADVTRRRQDVQVHRSRRDGAEGSGRHCGGRKWTIRRCGCPRTSNCAVFQRDDTHTHKAEVGPRHLGLLALNQFYREAEGGVGQRQRCLPSHPGPTNTELCPAIRLPSPAYAPGIVSSLPRP